MWRIAFLLALTGCCYAMPQHEASLGEGTVNDICEPGYACVSWQVCVGGTERPANYEELKCATADNMCCEVSDDLLTSLFNTIGGVDPLDTQEPSELPISCGHSSYDCVPYFQCVDGVINTDGRDLIDIRVLTPASCSNPDYPQVPAVCCLIPGSEPIPEPVSDCPGYDECVDFSQCSNSGRVVTDGSGLIDIRTGFTSCYLQSGIAGRCCTPPSPFVEICPEGSTCVLGDTCDGQVLDAQNNFVDYQSNALWTHCSHGATDGVCCIGSPAKIENCPGESICVQPHECTGVALNDLEQFVDYTPEGSWTHCTAHDQGVCCVKSNPFPQPAGQCGIRNENVIKRITSNNEASFGEFPWQAIIFYENYTFACGASLISSKFLLTAAHCIDNLRASVIWIRLGEWQVNSFEEELPYVDLKVQEIYIHPKFNPQNVHNDIAVIELIDPISFQYHINSICLPSEHEYIEPGTQCIATGWGKDSFSGSFQHILKEIKLPYVESNTCQGLLRQTRLGKYFRLHDSFICAGGEENKDACYGDGGGPLVCHNPTNSQYFLAGITAWGIGCGVKDVPGVYVNVAKFRPWIDGIVGVH